MARPRLHDMLALRNAEWEHDIGKTLLSSKMRAVFEVKAGILLNRLGLVERQISLLTPALPRIAMHPMVSAIQTTGTTNI